MHLPFVVTSSFLMVVRGAQYRAGGFYAWLTRPAEMRHIR